MDERSQKNVLSAIASCMRTFRKTLTTHIYAHKSDPVMLSKPPEIYSFLEQKEWDLFVERRLSKEFEVCPIIGHLFLVSNQCDAIQVIFLSYRFSRGFEGV